MAAADTLISLSANRQTEVNDTHMLVSFITINTRSGLIVVVYSYGHLQEARWVQAEGGSVDPTGEVHLREAAYNRVFNGDLAFTKIKTELNTLGML